jgi:hypothetical protein
MNVAELLADLFGRVDDHVTRVLDGLDPEWLTLAPEPGANPIGWLVWHLTRVQDGHVAELVGEDEVWVAGDWGPRFGIESDPADSGWGHGPDDVARVRPVSVDALTGYYREVAARTRDLLGTLTPADLDRVVDERWDPPVTLGVRLVSVADDDIQHAGQAAYVRGLLERR